MRYSGSYKEDRGFVSFYLALKTTLFEKLYNEISSGIIPTYVSINWLSSLSDSYEDYPIKYGDGELEYSWDNINHQVVKLDTLEFDYDRQNNKKHRSYLVKLIDYLKSHKFETALGIIILIFALKSLG